MIMSENQENSAVSLPKLKNTLFKIPSQIQEEETVGVSNGSAPLRMDIAKLPKMPTPRLEARRRETTVGVSIVLAICTLVLILTHGVALTWVGGIIRKSTGWWILLVLSYSEALIALVCLVGLLLTDPGVVERSPETCFPIPAEVATWLEAESRCTGSKEDVIVDPPKEVYIKSSDPGNQDTYCTRCLVWRRMPKTGTKTKFYHCNTCQRCVKDFDHHCSVFGRCIGGTRWHGNLNFFQMIITMGIAGYLTTIVALIWSFSNRYRPQIAVPILLLLIWFFTTAVLSRRGGGPFYCCWAILVGCIARWRIALKL